MWVLGTGARSQSSLKVWKVGEGGGGPYLPAPNAFFLLLFFELYPMSACLFTNLPFQLDNH